MSQETMQWLNQNCLIGFTDKRGTAWHYRASDQGAEPNHYPGAIPIEDIRRRLFSWEPIESPLYVDGIGASDGAIVAIPGRKAIRRSDSGLVLGIFKDGYKPHPYGETLIDKLALIIGEDLGVASALLLRNGARASVTVERPDTISTPEGIDFRPFIQAATSFDGSLASTYSCNAQLSVCDNTLAIALGEQGQKYKVRHSKYSGLKIAEAREALEILYTATDDFSAQVSEWCATPVSDKQFDAVLNALIPVPEDEGRGQTRAQNRQSDVRGMYHGDVRCAPWAGSKFGVVQTFNTYLHHTATQKGGVHRAERNIDNALSGKIEENDSRVIAAVDAILA